MTCRNATSRWFGTLLAVLLMYSLWPTQPAHAVQATYYAAPNGSGNTCSEAAPCSLTGARDKVRTINQNMTGDIVVYLRGGTYALATPFELTESNVIHDSGTNGYTISYRSYPGEQPVLSGGETIGGWTLHDSAKQIYRANVNPSLRTRQIYINGVRATRARSVGGLPGTITQNANGYTTTDTAMQSWSNIDDLEFVYSGGGANQNALWVESRCGVNTVAPTNGITAITMDQPCYEWGYGKQSYSQGLTAPTYIENAYELVDQPGEWYLDETLARLYYIPRSTEDLANATVIAARLETLVALAGSSLDTPIHHIQFQGITFSYATWLVPSGSEGFIEEQTNVIQRSSGAGSAFIKSAIPGNVVVRTSHHIRFERNIFRGLGASGLSLDTGSQSNTVIGNTFTDISGSAIRLGDVVNKTPSDTRLRDTNNTVSNNYIFRIAVEYRGGVGVFAGYTAHSIIEHNDIDNLPYSGIAIGYGWGGPVSYAQNNAIRYNRITNTMLQLADGGAIYTNGKTNTPVSTITNNYISGVYNEYGAIYPDEGSSNYVISNNVILGAPRWLNIWTSSIQDNTASTNYSDTSAYRNDGVNNTIEPAIILSGTAWPQAAIDIMNNAGLELAYQDLKQGQPTNLALNKPVTNSSGSGGGSYLVDGLTNGGVATKWWADSVPQWAAVDLGQVATISRWVVKHAGAGGENTIFNTGAFKLERSNDGTTWVDVDTVSGNNASVTDRIVTPFTARYVRLYVTQANLTFDDDVRIYEFEVWGQPLVTNLALNKPITNSSGSSGSIYLVDGSITGGTNTKWWADSVPQWAAVDLGQMATISRWVVKHAGAAGENSIFNTGAFTLQRSDDGTTWIDVDIVSGNSASVTDRGVTPFMARYVRLYVSQANLTFDDDVRIYEFEVWGVSNGSGAPTSTNVALNKPASASSEWSSDCTVAKANNGSTDAGDSCGGWSTSASDTSGWWQVDLGSAYRITSLELVTRQNCCDNASTRQNFELRASNDPNFGSYVVLGSQGSTPLPFQATWSANVSDTNSYRYVRAVRNGYFFIAELRVYGVNP
jgi:hypothetical protein